MGPRSDVRAPQAWPLWALVLAGALAGATWRAPRPPARAPAVRHPPAPDLLERGAARELRALPGLGERRALELVEARWRRAPGDPPLHLRDLPGVGPALEAAVRSALWPVDPGAADSP